MPHKMNAGKEAVVRRLLVAWRRTAERIAAEQWRLFFDRGAFDRRAKLTYPEDPIGAARVQMVRSQVVGILTSFLSNCASDFRKVVEHSTLDQNTRHQLHIINKREAWFDRDPVTAKSTTSEVPEPVRRLARSIMRSVLRRHRRPRMANINALIDQRGVKWGPSLTASSFPLWVTLNTTERRPTKTGKPSKAYETVHVPLNTYEYFTMRPGRRCLGIQINENNDGTIAFAVVTETTQAFEASRAGYQPAKDVLGLDFGLRTMFATSDGDLFGRNWFEKLKRFDAEITALAQAAQKAGRKPKDDPAYRAGVTRLRGYVKTEVGRVINAIIANKRPEELAVERLDFRSPELSRRMNRILQNCGRSVIRIKLKDVFERFGVSSAEINPAYSSQECHRCGYVDRKNRSGATFKCRHCGHTASADVNGARNVRSRRSWPKRHPHQTKAQVLDRLISQFIERHPGGWVSSGAGQWQGNPYFATVRRASQEAPDAS
ncbi:zinc ribbon domain-containing protein [Caenispirillum salinarum]|uniref:zinc ribbon domain-containing protein n=1 Tax=Caenispirillum salinarum TaxID=859058 RepID=UPI00384CD653